MDSLMWSLMDPVANMAPNNNLLNESTIWGDGLCQNILPELDICRLQSVGVGGSDPTPSPVIGMAPAAGHLNAVAPSTWAWGGPIANAQISQLHMPVQAIPCKYDLKHLYGSISPSHLAPSSPVLSSPSTLGHSPSLDLVDKVVTMPPRITFTVAPSSAHVAVRNRTCSIDPDKDGEADTTSKTRTVVSQHDQGEGVERNGMIWGMKLEEYQALSARERKRVRNRISARTFRAKRRQHISFMDATLIAKDLEIHQASQENSRLRGELAALKQRLSKHEKRPY